MEYYELTEYEREILEELILNPRKKAKEIGKKLRMHEKEVESVIKDLEKKKIILGYSIGLNFTNFGAFTTHVLANFRDEKEKKKAIRKLTKMEEVNTIITYIGNWEMEVSIVAGDVDESEELVSEISKIMETERYEVLTKIATIKYGTFGKARRKTPREKELLDEIDFELIALLSKNSRLEEEEIGEKIGIPPEEVKRRIHKLLLENYITDFRLILDYTKLRFFQFSIFLKLKNYGKKQEKKMEKIREEKEVFWAAKSLGGKLILYFLAKTPEAVRKIGRRLNTLFGKNIEIADLLLMDKVLKYSYYTASLRRIYERKMYSGF